MTASDLAIAITSSVTAGGAVAGLVLWLTKAWITARLQGAIRSEYDSKLETLKAQLQASNDTQLERLKAQLRAQSDVELERLKSSLYVAATEQNATLTRLHDKRFEVIAKIYKKLRALHARVEEYTNAFGVSGEPPRAEKFAETVKSFNDFNPYFVGTQIFLPRELAKTVGKLKQDLVSMTNTFLFMVDQNKGDPTTWIEILRKLDEESKPALEALEEAMRVELGDKPSPAAIAVA